MMNMRYFSNLLLLSMISFGTHFSHSSLSMFGVFFVEDKLISTLGLSVLFASSFLTTIFLPLIIGYAIDVTKRLKIVTLSLLALTTFGQAAFAVAMCRDKYWMALLAQIVFGSGASSISAVQRIAVAHYLNENASFNTGVYVAVAGVSKLLGKALVAPVAIDLDSYKEALMLNPLLCGASLLCYLFFLFKETWLKRSRAAAQTLTAETSSSQTRGVLTALFSSERYVPCALCGTDVTWCMFSFAEYRDVSLGPRFYKLVALHTLYITIFHLLQSFTPHLATVLWHDTLVDAGYISGIPPLLTIFIAPFVGYFANSIDHITDLSCGAAALVVLGFVLLLASSIDPIVALTLISLAQAALPTLILTSIVMSVSHNSHSGVAFGIVEAWDGVASVLGTLAFGYLYYATGSYFAGLTGLLGLSGVALCLCVQLKIEGVRERSFCEEIESQPELSKEEMKLLERKNDYASIDAVA